MTHHDTTHLDLERRLAAEFDGKSRDHVVTADTHPQLISLFMQAALAELNGSDTSPSSDCPNAPDC